MRQLKASDFATDRDYKEAQRQLRKADKSKRAGRDMRRQPEQGE